MIAVKEILRQGTCDRNPAAMIKGENPDEDPGATSSACRAQ
jgi:hypothetical protein